ncbi:MAG TPA: hypothetical protein VM884_05895, partial [Flavisolibacter sp.]|nr:hypothetical protein [Flavisolibacter sp.]
KTFFMKSTVLTGLLFLSTGVITNAQLSFLPQVGLEQSRAALNYGNGLSALNTNGNLKAALKVDYRLKGGHAPFINLGTSPAPISFAFDNAGSLLQSYQSAKSNLQFRMEAGYQYSSSPIQLGKKSSASKNKAAITTNEYSQQRSSCGAITYRSRCGAKKTATKITQVAAPLNMRLQPSLAFAYIPSGGESVKQTANGFEYNAAPKTAIVPAMGFEFAKGTQRLFTLSVFYTKAVGQSQESVTSFSNTKPTITRIQPNTSTWGMTLGVPFSFTRSKAVKAVKETREKKNCTRNYYRRCTKTI